MIFLKYIFHVSQIIKTALYTIKKDEYGLLFFLVVEPCYLENNNTFILFLWGRYFITLEMSLFKDGKSVYYTAISIDVIECSLVLLNKPEFDRSANYNIIRSAQSSENSFILCHFIIKFNKLCVSNSSCSFKSHIFCVLQAPVVVNYFI